MWWVVVWIIIIDPPPPARAFFVVGSQMNVSEQKLARQELRRRRGEVTHHC